MEETNDFVPVEPTVEESKPLNAFQRFTGVFTAPLKTFQEVAARPDWIAPLLILVLVSVVLTQLMMPAIMSDASRNIDKLVESGTIPQDQADRAMEASQGFTRNFAPVMGGISVIVIALLASGVLLFVGNVIMAGKANFRQIFSLYLWTGMVDLIGTILRAPLALKQNTMLIFFSPAAFFAEEARDTALFKITSFLDVFVLWRVILIAIGFMAVYRFTMGKSAAAILAIFALLIASSVVFSGMF